MSSLCFKKANMITLDSGFVVLHVNTLHNLLSQYFLDEDLLSSFFVHKGHGSTALSEREESVDHAPLAWFDWPKLASSQE